MGKSKIDWCDNVWNPVWGCKTGCPFCYARKFAKRFGKSKARVELHHLYPYTFVEYKKRGILAELARSLQNFELNWLESNFVSKFPKTPKRIFVGSMSDIYWWGIEWVERVLEKIKKYPQHRFLFLTKFPQVYKKYSFPKNCWLGATAIIDDEVLACKNCLERSKLQNLNNIRFLSIEPIQEKISEDFAYYSPDWVIVGMETGNRRGKIVPPKEWITDIVYFCKRRRIPIFLKENITNIYTDLKIYKEFPDEK